MPRTQLIAFASTLLLATAAHAQQGARTTDVRDNNFSYTYADIGYETWEYDFGPGDLEADALVGQGSYALDEHIFLRGGVTFYEIDDVPRNIDDDGNRLSVGLGFNTPLKQGLDLVATGDIVRDDNDFDDETGLVLTGGVRHRTTSQLELQGGLFFEDIYEEADDIGLYGQGLFHANEQIDIGARVRLAGDIETFGLFGRYNF